MKARPILFIPPMVRASRDGTKTQTRRIAKLPIPHPEHSEWLVEDGRLYEYRSDGSRWLHAIRCPYGKPGDRLWVRESFFQFGHWQEIAGVKTKHGRQKWRFVATDDYIRYVDAEDAPQDFRRGRSHRDPHTPAWHLRLARFMPRRFSRLTLEIAAIRLEPLQKIRSTDAIAEGIRVEKGSGMIEGQDCYMMTTNSGYCRGPIGAIMAYEDLWKSIHGPDSWNTNPVVWAVTFKKTHP